MGDVNAAAETIRRKLAHRNGVTDPEGAKALDALVAERQQAIDERDAREKIVVEQQETVTRLRDEVDRLDAKVALLDDRNHWRWPNERALRLGAEARCEQAIDALREIAKIEDSFQAQSRYTGTVATCFHDCPAMARAALVSLGETE